MVTLNAPEGFKAYELIDAGGGEKLERFGEFVLRRPEPQAVWSPALPENVWQKHADAVFKQEGSASGSWHKLNPNMPDVWHLQYEYENMRLKFRLALTRFKHVGIFPEQAVNWDFIYDRCRRNSSLRVLNLFAYTGGASLAARAGGADVIHCDSIKQVVSWARKNQDLSGLTDIRWLVEDAFKFVRREANRGRQYEGIILDPPAWGHGPKGEKWKLEEQINELIGYVARLLAPKASFLVFNAYSLGYSPLILENLIRSHFDEKILKQLEAGELYLRERSGRRLPAGVFVRFGV